MDTKLKKGKLIRAYIYRTMTFIMLCFMIFFAICFYPRFDSLTELNFDLLLEGDINAIPEYRETTENLFNNLMLSTFDVGDADGLQVDKNGKIRKSAETTYQDIINQGGFYFCIFNVQNKNIKKSNTERTVFSQTTGKLVVPDNMELCYCWDATTKTTTAGLNYSLANIGSGAYKPVAENSTQFSVAVMVYKKDNANNNGIPDMYQREANTYCFLLWGLIISFSSFILFSLMSLCTKKAGKKSSEIVASVTKHIVLEVKLLFIAGIIVSLINIIPWLCFYLGNRNVTMITLYLSGILGLAILLSFIKNDIVVNQSEFFKNNLITIGIHAIRKLSESDGWEKKFFLLTDLSLLCGFLFSIGGAVLFTYYYLASYEGDIMVVISALFLIIGVLLLILGYINANRLRTEVAKVAQALSAMRHGTNEAQLTLSKHAYLQQTATDINELEKGIELTVEQKSKADRMRVELITNVSHDLKTPLTSIINYADLLCEEPLDEKTKQYASAIQEKSYHLKNMVQDVFELSKATTGNLVVKKHSLDIIKLLYQTLADMNEKITECSLTFKTQIPEVSAMIEGDGDKIYRVFLNLYMNAIHYSLENSRVYTIVKLENGSVTISIKNTSKNELDFNTEEIIERFVRADKSRTGEGSGLGLSIAKSFAEACGGTFRIETDADMFTAITSFPLSTPEQEVIQAADGSINEVEK